MTKTEPLSSKAVQADLILEDGSVFEGYSFGFPGNTAGEVVFNTGMVGYPETLSDPSYFGQILTLTYPLIGNYGVPSEGVQDNLKTGFESDKLQISGLIISDFSENYSHWNARKSLARILQEQKIPALYGIDTRALTKKLRESGTMLGKIQFENSGIEFFDPNDHNVVENVSIRKPLLYGKGSRRVVLMDCGCKHNIIRNLVKRGVEVLRVPWNYDIRKEEFDGLFISNGPGNPKMCRTSILQIHSTIKRDIPTFGICLGNQLLALATGANTYKLKYGHRSQNQPVLEIGGNKGLVTSQNHGFAVDQNTLPDGWSPWFINLNDGTNEGIRHESGRFMSVQFHPEAAPGPVDAEYLFDEFIKIVER